MESRARRASRSPRGLEMVQCRQRILCLLQANLAGRSALTTTSTSIRKNPSWPSLCVLFLEAHRQDCLCHWFSDLLFVAQPFLAGLPEDMTQPGRKLGNCKLIL